MRAPLLLLGAISVAAAASDPGVFEDYFDDQLRSVDIPQESALKACLSNGDATGKKIQTAYDSCFGTDYDFNDLADNDEGKDSDGDDLPDEYEANEACFYSAMGWVSADGSDVSLNTLEEDMAGLEEAVAKDFKANAKSCSKWSGDFGGGRRKREAGEGEVVPDLMASGRRSLGWVKTMARKTRSAEKEGEDGKGAAKKKTKGRKGNKTKGGKKTKGAARKKTKGGKNTKRGKKTKGGKKTKEAARKKTKGGKNTNGGKKTKGAARKKTKGGKTTNVGKKTNGGKKTKGAAGKKTKGGKNTNGGNKTKGGKKTKGAARKKTKGEQNTNGGKKTKGGKGKKTKDGKKSDKDKHENGGKKGDEKEVNKKRNGKGDKEKQMDEKIYNKLWCFDLAVEQALEKCVEDKIKN